MVEQCGAQDIIDDIKMGSRTSKQPVKYSQIDGKKNRKANDEKKKQSNRMLKAN